MTKQESLFTFGHNLVECDETNHFYLGFTSEILLKRITNFNNQGCYHIDATYKIVKYSYSLVIIGFTDIERKFWPVAFMFSSHEQIPDFEHFLNSLLNLCKTFQINFYPRYIIIDACSAMESAINKIFPSSILLMCWFHLKQNIRKRKLMIGIENYETINQDINKLHQCTTLESYKVNFK